MEDPVRCRRRQHTRRRETVAHVVPEIPAPCVREENAQVAADVRAEHRGNLLIPQQLVERAQVEAAAAAWGISGRPNGRCQFSNDLLQLRDQDVNRRERFTGDVPAQGPLR